LAIGGSRHRVSDALIGRAHDDVWGTRLSPELAHERRQPVDRDLLIAYRARQFLDTRAGPARRNPGRDWEDERTRRQQQPENEHVCDLRGA
jgi:hypothetical protein